MGLAFRLSKRNLGMCWPNPCVGAVVVSQNDQEAAEIVGVGCTDIGGRPHAERVALAMAGDRARGGTLYVTLEPCSHHGKTPPCTDAIIEAGVKRVVYASIDADTRVAGSGISALKNAGIDVDAASDVMKQRIMRGARAHFKRVQTGLPFVQLKIAVGADGFMKPGTGTPEWVTGEEARARGHLLRARADAILVGKGTVVADNPSLTCRLPGLYGKSPVRVVIDTALEIGMDCGLVRTAREVPVWIFCGPGAPEDKTLELESRGVVVERVCVDVQTGRVDLTAVLKALAQKGITRVLVEGGPTISRSLVEADLVDEVYVFQGARSAGGEAIDPVGGAGLGLITDSANFKALSGRPVGPDMLSVYQKV